MTISQVAAATGLSVHAIRFYERTGVLRRIGRLAGVRSFSIAEVRALTWVAHARGIALPLSDVQATIDVAALPASLHVE